MIIPARYLNKTDPWELSQHCMERIDPEFVKKAKPGDILVTVKNFGCDSSREHAPLAIKAYGISCVIAKTFARIFYRNAFNIGFPILEWAGSPGQLQEGQEIKVDLDIGQIDDLL